jgi:hypothetical protein
MQRIHFETAFTPLWHIYPTLCLHPIAACSSEQWNGIDNTVFCALTICTNFYLCVCVCVGVSFQQNILGESTDKMANPASIIFYTNVVPFCTTGSFWMKEDWNTTHSKIEPIFLFFSPNLHPFHPRVCLENCKIWLTQQQKSSVVYMVGSSPLWYIYHTFPPISSVISQIQKKNIFPSFQIFHFLFPSHTVISPKLHINLSRPSKTLRYPLIWM